MSQGAPSFQPRNTAQARLPDRPAQSLRSTLPQQQYGQSVPNFAQRPQGQQSLNPYPLYPYGAQPAQPYGANIPQDGRSNTVKESNNLGELSDEQREEINEAFGYFDLDKDGRLDFHELRVTLRALGFQLPKNEVLQLMSTHGEPKAELRAQNPGRGPNDYHPSQLRITRPAFVAIAGRMILDRDPKVEIDRAFQLYSKGNSVITLDDLRRVTVELGETSLDEQELQSMIEEFDYEGLGGVKLEAFHEICWQSG